jgi:nucleoside-triphosphatase THEP1
MSKNVFITGIPGVGKTTLVKKLAHDLSMLVIKGFYKEKIIEDDSIRGFRVVSFDYQEQILAHLFIEGPNKIDGFGVNIEGFEKFILPQIQNIDIVDLFIFDEIGKMECMSDSFCSGFEKIIESNTPVIATYSHHSAFKFNVLKKRKDTTFLQMTSKNRDNIWKQILLAIE